jgi:hypothetical protein
VTLFILVQIPLPSPVTCGAEREWTTRNSEIAASLRVADVHVSLCQEKTQFSRRALQRSAQNAYARTRSSHVCLSAMIPAFAEPDIHSLSQALRPSQKIECVFSASPETIRREPLEFYLHRSVGYMQDLAVCALCDPVLFLLQAAV